MNDSAFDQALDALVAGYQPEQQDDLTQFVAGMYRKEQDVRMPIHHRVQLASALGVDVPVTISTPSGVFGREGRGRGRSRQFTWLAVAAAFLLALTGVFNWGMPHGGEENRFLNVPSAVPTVQATPLVSGDVPAWMMPITASECPRDEMVTSNAEVNPSAIWYSEDDYAAVPEAVVYGPFRRADPASAEDVVTRVREYYACQIAIIGGQTLPISSPRFEYETRTTSGRTQLAARKSQQIQAAKDLSLFYETELGLSPQTMMIHQPNPELAAQSYAAGGMNNLYNPDHVVALADGRMAVMLSLVGFGDEYPYDIANEPVYVPPVFLMIQIDGQWYVDEMLRLCLGDCAMFWSEQANAALDAWQQPISSYECALAEEQLPTPTTGSLEPQEFPARAFYPLQLPDYFSRMDAWTAAREMRSCMNTIGIQSFWSDRWVYEQYALPKIDPQASDDLAVDQITRGLMLSTEYVDKVGVTPDQMILRYNVDDPEVFGLDPGTYAVINPDWIVQTADGRQIVLMTAMVVSDGEMPLVRPDASQPGGMAWVLIENDGVWQIDEYLPVCIGTEEECAPFWQQQPGWRTYQEMRATPATEVCVASEDFIADYEVNAGRAINLRPGPGVQSGDAVAVVEDGQMLQYLCQRELTTDLEGDDLLETDNWLFVRTEDGDEGWVRETDVRPTPEIATSQSPVSSPIASAEVAETLFQPVTADECQLPPVGDSQAGTRPSSQTKITARSYDSLSAPTRDDAEAAAMAARQVDSCLGIADPAGFATSAYVAITNTMMLGFNPLLPVFTEQKLADSMEISALFAADSQLTAADMVVVIGKDDPESALVPPGDYPLPLAEFAMQTPDGRIAVPVVMATVNPVDSSGTRSVESAVGLVYLMGNEGGEWKLDDVLYLCLGECEWFFSYQETTSHLAVWHRPISPEECVGNYGVLPNWELATIVAIGSRQYDACQHSGGNFDLKTETFAVADLEQARQLSSEIEEHGANKDNLRSNVPLGLFPGMDVSIGTYAAFDPDNAVLLSDGRIAVLQTEVTTWEDAAPQARRTPQVITRVLVWQEVDDQWRLDTEAEVCLGDCEAFWIEQSATPNP